MARLTKAEIIAMLLDEAKLYEETAQGLINIGHPGSGPAIKEMLDLAKQRRETAKKVEDGPDDVQGITAG